MPTPSIITLTTDFGQRDTFVGQMKGRILGLAPRVHIVDVTHDVPPHDIQTASFLLLTAYAAFPEGTIHLVVVDPGVGTARRAVVVDTPRYRFLAPDNGVLTRVLEREPPRGAWILDGAAADVAPTFHGRDVFAPAAAVLAGGADPASLGPPAGPLHALDLPRATPRPGVWQRVRVVQIDRFGNATLDLPRERIEALLGERAADLVVRTPAGEARGLCRTYGEATGRGPVLLFNSADHLEVAEYGASAARRLRLSLGDDVEIRFPPPTDAP